MSEHIEFIRRLYGIDDDGYAKELMDRFEMWINAGKLGKAVQGMRQKVSIMRRIAAPEGSGVRRAYRRIGSHSIKELKKLFIELQGERGGSADQHAYDRQHRGFLGCGIYYEQRKDRLCQAQRRRRRYAGGYVLCGDGGEKHE